MFTHHDVTYGLTATLPPRTAQYVLLAADAAIQGTTESRMMACESNRKSTAVSWHPGLDDDAASSQHMSSGSPVVQTLKERSCFGQLLLIFTVFFLPVSLDTVIMAIIFLVHLCFLETTQMQRDRHQACTLQAFPYSPNDTACDSQFVCVVLMLPTGITAPTILQKPKYIKGLIPVMPEGIEDGRRTPIR